MGHMCPHPNTHTYTYAYRYIDVYMHILTLCLHIYKRNRLNMHVTNIYPPTHYLYAHIISRLGESLCTLPHAPEAVQGAYIYEHLLLSPPSH